jgi:bifunctional non-homologous end joining protein LigD
MKSTATARAQVDIRGGKVTVYTRRGHDWTNQFAKAAAKLDVRDAIIEGEATVLGSNRGRRLPGAAA